MLLRVPPSKLLPYQNQSNKYIHLHPAKYSPVLYLCRLYFFHGDVQGLVRLDLHKILLFPPEISSSVSDGSINLHPY
jgi:hypothetical protein